MKLKSLFSPEERERRAAQLDHSCFYDMLIALPKGNRNLFVFWVGGRFQIITYTSNCLCSVACIALFSAGFNFHNHQSNVPYLSHVFPDPGNDARAVTTLASEG